MAGDVPKPIKRGRPPGKPAAIAPIPVMAPPAKLAAPVKVATPIAHKPGVAKAAPAPVLPAPMVAAPRPAPVIPAAAVPEIAAPEVIAPQPVAAAAPEPVSPAPAPEVSPAAILQKETTMDATIPDATAKAQAFFGEANTRAKAAMEKSAKMLEEINTFSKGNIEAVVESSKIAAKGIETLGQEAADYTRKQFEGATAMMKSFASVKSPAELFKMQSDYIRQSFDALVAESSKATEAMLKLAGEVAQPLSNRVALATEKAKLAA
ncbi:hypothetical protein BH10PSE15_BH10PSE15_12760 [soil metagenome]